MEKSANIITIDTAFEQAEAAELAQTRQEIVQELGSTAIGADLVETNPLDELAAEIDSAPKPVQGRVNLDSETHRSPRFKRDRFKTEAAAAAKPKKRRTVLSKRLNNLAERQNTRVASFMHGNLDI